MRWPICRYLRLFLLLLVAVSALACTSRKANTDQVGFSDEERLLIDAYVKVVHARKYYPHQPIIADSLLSLLSTEIDTVLINNAVAKINNTPDRWLAVFEEIETRLRGPSQDPESE